MSTQPVEVDVQVYSFKAFFEERAIYPVGIDSYQRPYVWGEDKISDLIRDLKAYIENPRGLKYYMGSILLHQHNSKLYIIDGQQRLSTLCILYYVLNGHLLPNGRMAMEYNSPISVRNIRNAKLLFEAIKEKWLDQADFLFRNLQFTFITTLSEDLAFTFFDTQNNRGVKLNPTDLLKAYHLRAIGNAAYSNIQKECAARWEKIQGQEVLFGQQKDFVAELFHQFLWRSRCWKGQKVIYREDNEDILHEFQKKTIPHTHQDTVPLYPGANNILATALQMNSPQQLSLQTGAITISSTSAYLPFTLRQPISEGLGFFLFAEKYASLIKVIFFDKNPPDPEIGAVRTFYEEVLQHLSLYLKELHLLAIVMYFDKFGTRRILEFTLCLDHVIGALRLEKYAIYREATIKFLKEVDHNIFDVISQAFLPEEVIGFLKELKYAGANVEIEKVYARTDLPESGVKAWYKNSILTYYNKETFSGKSSWISPEFIKYKLQ